MKNYITLKNTGKAFPKEHLISNITKGRHYEVIDKYRRGVTILDDTETPLHLSGGAVNKYFDPYLRLCQMIPDTIKEVSE